MEFIPNRSDPKYYDYYRFIDNVKIKLNNVNEFELRVNPPTKDLFDYQITYGKINLSNILFKYINKKFNFIKNKYQKENDKCIRFDYFIKLDHIIAKKANELYSLLMNSTYKPPICDKDKTLRKNFLNTLRRTKRIIKPFIDKWFEHPAFNHSELNIINLPEEKLNLFENNTNAQNPALLENKVGTEPTRDYNTKTSYLQCFSNILTFAIFSLILFYIYKYFYSKA